jgi:hypothetical protein
MVMAVALLLGLLPTGVAAASIGGWTATGPVSVDHAGQPAVLLNSGKVLAVGGQVVSDTYNPPSNLAMLYNPVSGTWSPTGSLGKGRASHTATLLANGKVLVAGGDNGTEWKSAELYDPATNSWSPTGPMLGARSGQTAVRLTSGKVLVVGGVQGGGALTSAELYDPATGTWSGTGSLSLPRFYHAMTLLNNGMVLVSGGYNLLTGEATASVERYDPATGSWTKLPSMLTPRAGHTMTTLPSGDVLVNGGYFAGRSLASTELYSPAGNSWALTGGMSAPRFEHTTILLANGKALTFDGYAVGSQEKLLPNTSSELYDPAKAVPTYALALTTAGPGTALAFPPGGVYPGGTTVVLYAKPDPGQIFLGWTVDGVAKGWPDKLAVTMDGPHAVSMTFTTLPSFPDVPSGDPAQEAIQQLAARGIIKGYGDGRFGPGDTTRRAQMAALIARAMGWDQENHGNPFNDGNGIDPNLWRNVGTLAYYDVAHGYGNGHFGPNDTVTKAQVISFITRAMVKKGYWQLRADDPTLFTDVPAASGQRQDLATYYYYAGYLPEQQSPDYPFSDWNAPSTRGWFAQTLWRALDYYFGYNDLV